MDYPDATDTKTTQYGGTKICGVYTYTIVTLSPLPNVSSNSLVTIPSMNDSLIILNSSNFVQDVGRYTIIITAGFQNIARSPKTAAFSTLVAEYKAIVDNSANYTGGLYSLYNAVDTMSMFVFKPLVKYFLIPWAKPIVCWTLLNFVL